jgi:hypothetical protein
MWKRKFYYAVVVPIGRGCAYAPNTSATERLQRPVDSYSEVDIRIRESWICMVGGRTESVTGVQRKIRKAYGEERSAMGVTVQNNRSRALSNVSV